MKNQNKIILTIAALLFCIAICITGVHVKEAYSSEAVTVITAIDVVDNAIEIKANRHFVYTIYKPSDPFRVVVEMPDADIGAFKDAIKSSKAGISEVIPSQISSPRNIARVEMLLQTPADLEPSYYNNVLTLRVKEEVKEEPKAAASQAAADEKVAVKEADEAKPAPAAAIAAGDTGPLPKATEITDVRFEQAEGLVKFVVKANGSMNPSVFTLKDRIVVDIPDVKMKSDIPHSAISPVKRMRVGKYKEKTRLVMDLTRDADFDVTTIKDTVVVALKVPEIKTVGYAAPKAAAHNSAPEPAIKNETETKPAPMPEMKDADMLVEGRYTGKKISLDFQDADIIPIFRLLADISGYNFVVNPEVKGKITMKLVNVPWDQALELVLKIHNLGKAVDGNIIRIAPHAVFAKEAEEKLKTKDAEAKAEPLETRTYNISYADVKTVESAVKELLTKGRGSVTVDKRTSTMVVKDVPSAFSQIESLLATLDKPTPQVMIEARIVEMSTGAERELGIQWGLEFNATNTLASGGGLSTLGRGAFTGNNYLVDFPSGAGQGKGSGFNFGILNPAKTMGLDMQISALASVGKTKIVSTPRVMTVDNGKAKISQGDSIPIRKLTAEGTVSTEFKDYTLDLVVTPHITPDGSIAMTIDTKKEEPDWSRVSLEGTPASFKREANTSVIIRDGETVVIGGVYKTTSSDTDEGVPGLMDIPILGWLFKSNKVKDSTSEMLIFITPRIVQKP